MFKNLPLWPRKSIPLFSMLALLNVRDRVVCAVTPEPFRAVGMWYDDFSQTSDVEVRELLAQAGRKRFDSGTAGAMPMFYGL